MSASLLTLLQGTVQYHAQLEWTIHATQRGRPKMGPDMSIPHWSATSHTCCRKVQQHTQQSMLVCKFACRLCLIRSILDSGQVHYGLHDEYCPRKAVVGSEAHTSFRTFNYFNSQLEL